MNAGRTRVAPTVAPRRQPLTISGDLVIAVVIVAAAPMFGFWIGHGGIQQFATAAGAATAVGQLTALCRYVPGARAARVDVTQPVARPNLRDGPTRRLAPLARLRDGLAARRPRRVHHDRLRRRERHVDRRGSVGDGHDLPVRPHGGGIARAVHPRGRQLRALGTPTALVRDLVRPPSVRIPGDRARVCAPARRRHRFHGRRARTRLLDPVVRGCGRADPRVPGGPADRDLAAPRAARCEHRCRRAGRRLDLPHGTRPRPAPGGCGPVLPVAIL